MEPTIHVHIGLGSKSPCSACMCTDLDSNKVSCEYKWDKGKKYQALEYKVLGIDSTKEINPLNGLLSSEPKDWIRVKEEEDTE